MGGISHLTTTEVELATVNVKSAGARGIARSKYENTQNRENEFKLSSISRQIIIDILFSFCQNYEPKTFNMESLLMNSLIDLFHLINEITDHFR